MKTLHFFDPKCVLTNGSHYKYKADHKFHFCQISGKNWQRRNVAEKEVMCLCVDALRWKGTQLLTDSLHCKFAVVFFKNPSYQEIIRFSGNRKERRLRFDETFMRMILKGALHLLYDERNSVRILKIIPDGDSSHRRLDEHRLVWRLVEDNLRPLRNYVNISPDVIIEPVNSNHRRYAEDSDHYINANMLQLADMVLGSTIHCCLKEGIELPRRCNCGDQIGIDMKRGLISKSVREIFEKKQKRKGNFRNSGHFKSFAISEVSIVGQRWEFTHIEPSEIKRKVKTGSLF
ncbi:hypothetical protein GF338_08405 [candidate division WOR-3 bacterium]|nr:hypothetical protein [candidate division WOR-3 bacterium]